MPLSTDNRLPCGQTCAASAAGSRSTFSSRAARPDCRRVRRSPIAISSTTLFRWPKHGASRRRSSVRPRAAVSLLRHGHVESGLRHARRHDRLSVGGIRSARRVDSALKAERCTALHGVPTMFIAELEHPEFEQFDLSSLRAGIMAGSPCPVEVMRRVVDRMHMREVTIAYGMTETSPSASRARPTILSSGALRPSAASCRTWSPRSSIPTAAQCRAARPARSARAAMR